MLALGWQGVYTTSVWMLATATSVVGEGMWTWLWMLKAPYCTVGCISSEYASEVVVVSDLYYAAAAAGYGWD